MWTKGNADCPKKNKNEKTNSSYELQINLTLEKKYLHRDGLSFCTCVWFYSRANGQCSSREARRTRPQFANIIARQTSGAHFHIQHSARWTRSFGMEGEGWSSFLLLFFLNLFLHLDRHCKTANKNPREMQRRLAEVDSQTVGVNGERRSGSLHAWLRGRVRWVGVRVILRDCLSTHLTLDPLLGEKRHEYLSTLQASNKDARKTSQASIFRKGRDTYEGVNKLYNQSNQILAYIKY